MNLHIGTQSNVVLALRTYNKGAYIMLNNVRIVLVNTSDQRNIGSAARAMKTMGISDLVLVDPQEKPEGKAAALAAGATDILANARIVDTLVEAIDDCQLTFAASARSRTLDWPMTTPREASAKIMAEGQQGKVAIVFGREASGLTNDELQQCHVHTHIPANPEYSSLNLAMAVQTLCYEVRVAYLAAEEQAYPKPVGDYPTAGEMEGFFTHLQRAISDSGFIVKNHPGKVMSKLRRLYTRTRPDKNELNILRGILTSFERHVKK